MFTITKMLCCGNMEPMYQYSVPYYPHVRYGVFTHAEVLNHIKHKRVLNAECIMYADRPCVSLKSQVSKVLLVDVKDFSDDTLRNFITPEIHIDYCSMGIDDSTFKTLLKKIDGCKTVTIDDYSAYDDSLRFYRNKCKYTLKFIRLDNNNFESHYSNTSGLKTCSMCGDTSGRCNCTEHWVHTKISVLQAVLGVFNKKTHKIKIS